MSYIFKDTAYFSFLTYSNKMAYFASSSLLSALIYLQPIAVLIYLTACRLQAYTHS